MNKNILSSMEITPMTEEDLQSWLDKRDRIHLVFFDKQTPVGCVNFYHHKTCDPNYEVGYLVDPDFRGKGVAQEMLKQALVYAKSTLKIKRIEQVYIKESNIASKRVLEKNGFILDRYNKVKGRYYYYKNL